MTSSDNPAESRASRSLRGLAVASIVVWIPLLMMTQPEQQLRNQVERHLRSGRLHEAIAVFAAHERDDFPPHWDPPPRVGYGESNPSAFDVLHVIAATNAPAWIRAMYVEKLDDAGEGVYFGPWAELQDGSDERVQTILDDLEAMPEGSRLLEQQRIALERLSEDERRPPEFRDRVRDVIKRHQPASSSMGE